MSDTIKAYKVTLGPAKCAVDLGDGSERGPYVDQDYILHKLGRPHRAVNLMFCYYPYDSGWPLRASVAHADDNISYAWDYPYDDYFPYHGGLVGNKDSEVFQYMRDIRRHGQDVLLTLTIDPHVTDEHLIAIAKDLVPFGRVLLRINHEATGTWFSFNKRCSYQEVADFFVRFHKIIKEYASNVQTILCIGDVEDRETGRIGKEDEFYEAIRVADIWSRDQYLALHWGWPYDIAETGGNSHYRYNAKQVYDDTKIVYDRYTYLNDGITKPMVMSELNADGDVTGPYEQAAMVKEFADYIKNDDRRWFNAFTMYQFRDDGRLGLEITDPNNQAAGIEQPLMSTYKEIIHDDFFKPSLTIGEELNGSIKLRWGGSEDSEGIAIPVHFEGAPIFCEAYFEDDLKEANLMIEFNGLWFYKAPGVTCIDFMEAFFGKEMKEACDINMHIFAPPASGENDPSQSNDWTTNYYTTLSSLPKLRVRFKPTEI